MVGKHMGEEFVIETGKLEEYQKHLTQVGLNLIDLPEYLHTNEVNIQEKDELFEEAKSYLLKNEGASVGNLQRVFRIGFNRATRIMNQLADARIVIRNNSETLQNPLLENRLRQLYRYGKWALNEISLDKNQSENEQTVREAVRQLCEEEKRRRERDEDSTSEKRKQEKLSAVVEERRDAQLPGQYLLSDLLKDIERGRTTKR